MNQDLIVVTAMCAAAAVYFLGLVVGRRQVSRQWLQDTAILKTAHGVQLNELHAELARAKAQAARTEFAEGEMRRAQRMLAERESAGDCFDELAMLAACVELYLGTDQEEGREALEAAYIVARATLAAPEDAAA